MKPNILKIIFITGLIAGACASNNDKSNEGKKTKLEALRKEISVLEAEAIALEKEINSAANPIGKGKLVECVSMKKAGFKSYILIEGNVDANESTIATPKIPGTILFIGVVPGQRVSAGQVLANLDNTTMKQSKIELQQKLNFLVTLFEKQKRLWEKGVGTEIQYLTALNQKEGLEKSLNTLNAQMDMYTIKAPISGTVESLDVKIGQAVAPGMPLFRVVNLSKIKIKADVSESYSQKIHTGDPVIVFLPDLNIDITTRIQFAAKYIDPLNRTFRIEASLPNLENIKPNMIGKLKIIDYENKQALTVNTNCIQSTEAGSFVVVANKKNGQYVAKRHSVKLGRNSDGITEILEGLSEQDSVITTGYEDLIDDQIISVSKSNLH